MTGLAWHYWDEFLHAQVALANSGEPGRDTDGTTWTRDDFALVAV